MLPTASGQGWSVSPDRVEILGVVATRNGDRWVQTPEPAKRFLLRVSPDDFLTEELHSIQSHALLGTLTNGGSLRISAAAAVMLIVTGSEFLTVDRLRQSARSRLVKGALETAMYVGQEKFTLVITPDLPTSGTHVAAFDSGGKMFHLT